VRFLAQFSYNTLVGYTTAIRVNIFILLPAWGMRNAAATLVGQNLSAGNRERAGQSVWFTVRCNAIFLRSVGVFLVVFANPIVALFNGEPEAAAIAASCLLLVSCSYVFWSFGLVTVQTFNGCGDATTPTWINFFVF